MTAVIPRSRCPERSDLWSDHLRAHTRSWCAQITWSGENFELTFVWTMVWKLSAQRSVRSGTVWPEAVLSALLSDQRPIRAHTSLIRGRIVRTLVSSEADPSEVFFLTDRDCLSQKSTTQQHYDQRHIESLMDWSKTRGPAGSNCRSPSEKLWKNYRSRHCYAKLSMLIYSVKNMNFWHTQV